MSNYIPSTEFNQQFILLKPKIVTVKGSTKKVIEFIGTFFGSFRTFGGTETTSNGALVVENTAVVETWFNPNIASDCNIKTSDGQTYEILGTPENIQTRSVYMRFKIRAIKGGA